ncbi:MAG TPA: tetratricopeptide repeat protein, partial [Planctomycetota bacterium]|nr:tetratricopeptide repeat protein [Planctomycetota bacterium]
FGNQPNLFHYVLGGSFYLGSFLCYLRWVEGRRTPMYVLAVALCLCGLLTSITVMTLPVLILLHELLYRRARVVRSVARLLPFVACMLAVGACRLTLTPHPTFYVYAPTHHAGPLWHWLYSFGGGGIDRFLGLLRGWDVPAAVTGLAGEFDNAWNVWSIVWAVVAGVCVILSLWALFRKQWIGVGAFLLLLGVMPHFHSPLNLTDDYASWSHRYLPLVGFAFLAGSLADRLMAARRRLWRLTAATIAAAAVTACAVLLCLANVHARSPRSYWRHARTLNPSSETASIQLGKACLADGDETLAAKYLFNPIVQAARDSCLAMAEHYSSKRDFLAAVVHMQIANREDKYGLQLQGSMLTAARVLREAGAYDFAEQCLGQVLMANPYNMEALGRLAEILAAKGYLRAAIRCLEGVAELDPGDVVNADRLAHFRRRLHDPEQYDVPTRTDPPEPDWLRYATDQGRSNRIRDELIRLSDVHPRDPVIQMTVCVCLSEEKRHEEALKRINRALDVLPSHPYAWATKYWAAANAGKDELARQTLAQVKHLRPRDAMTWHQLGYTLSKSGHYDLAVDCFRTALRANPKMYESHNNLALLLAQRGLFYEQQERHEESIRMLEEALPHFEKALGVPERKRAGVHNGMGYVLMRLGQPEEAVRHLRESIRLDPRHPRAYHHLAELYQRQGRFAESIQVLNEALKAIPGGLSLQASLAQLLSAAPYAHLRDGKRAVALAEAVCREASPAPPEVLDVLAAAYAETGRFQEAARTAARAAGLAQAQGNDELARYIEERRRLYLMHRPYRMAPAR